MPRGLLIFALCLPLAILMGFLLSDPLMGSNMMVAGGLLMALLVPIALAVHHRALIWLAGAFITAFFLPGQPQMWMVMAAMSFGISILSRPLTKVKTKPVWDKWVLLSLVFVLTSVVITAVNSGGIGMRVLGSSMYGGRKYVALIASVIGFMALTLGVVPRKNALRDCSIYALGPVTTAFSNLAYMLGPAFYFLFLLFPVGNAVGQAQADLDPVLVGIKRYTGFGPASIAICMFCLLRWGFRGLCQAQKPWRALIMIAALFIGMLSGFRSSLVIVTLVAAIQFFAEGLHKTKYSAILGGILCGSIVFLGVFAESLPLAAQRAISFLPVKVDPVAAADARASLQWRFEMWRLVAMDVPNHLWLGKGYAIDPTDLYLAQESFRRGFVNDYEIAISAGDYHSGPLSILVPFGVVGIVAAICFFITSGRALYKNLRYGDSDLKNINVFLFSYFFGRLLFFLLFFGAVEADLWTFASTVGLSLAVNGGVKQPARESKARRKPAEITEPEPEMVAV